MLAEDTKIRRALWISQRWFLFVLLSLSLPLIIGFILFKHEIVLFLFGPQWAPTADFLPYILIFGLSLTVINSNIIFIQILGKANVGSLISILMMLLILIDCLFVQFYDIFRLFKSFAFISILFALITTLIGFFLLHRRDQFNYGKET